MNIKNKRIRFYTESVINSKEYLSTKRGRIVLKTKKDKLVKVSIGADFGKRTTKVVTIESSYLEFEVRGSKIAIDYFSENKNKVRLVRWKKFNYIDPTLDRKGFRKELELMISNI